MTDVLTDLSTRAGLRLKQRGERLVTAESCTGGWVAEAVTRVAGSSDWFDRGFVTYSNESKREMLGVDERTLAAHGALSEATAGEMVLGALGASRASLAVAITGVAGPGGGTAAKPVGMVCFAWARRDGEVRAETCHFSGDREAVRRQAVVRALEGLIEALDGPVAQE